MAARTQARLGEEDLGLDQDSSGVRVVEVGAVGDLGAESVPQWVRTLWVAGLEEGPWEKGRPLGLDMGPEPSLNPCPAHCPFSASRSVFWSP